MQKQKSFPIKIGLEVHGYLNTREKLFCMCRTSGENDDKPNSRICPICTGQPGSKPMMPNKSAMEKLIQIAFVLGCKINHDKKLIWQRKHYNWADLPKGYQDTISGAYSVPCAENGKFKGIKIRECHLEEDPAQWNPDSGKINYNRSGLPLIEIVTEPDFANADDVIFWLKDLLLSLSYIKAIRKNAGIKVDVNVSTYGDRVEMKNINSLDSIKRAIEYEVERQVENFSKGIKQEQESLAYDASIGKTIKMREKEGQADYRFIPDPDLPVIDIDVKLVKEIERALPEMPEVKLNKLIKKYKLDKSDAEILTKNLDLVEFVEALTKENISVKKYISWITIELLRILNYNRMQLEDVEIQPIHFAELIEAVAKGEITVSKGKQIMNDFIPKSFSIFKKKNIGVVGDDFVEKICQKVIKENKKAVEDFLSGEQNALNFLVGQVMRLSERRADFKIATECLRGLLNA